PNSANTSSKLVTILIRFNMFSLSARQIQNFRPGKGKLYGTHAINITISSVERLLRVEQKGSSHFIS
ncbi:hypothetical protein ACE3DT_004259, partial [Salmonella enterica]